MGVITGNVECSVYAVEDMWYLSGQLVLLRKVQEGMSGPLYREKWETKPEC